MLLATMETAVLNLAVMPEVDCNSNTLDAELEVKKLQELVRKLERQNEQLRTRAQPPLSPPYAHGRGAAAAAAAGGGYRGLSELDLRCLQLQGEDLGYFEPTVEEHGAGTEEEDEQALLDELELLDLDFMCSSEDSQETWLYMSQKSTDSSDSALSPLQWCRRALTSPKSELESSRKSLALRLEQVSRWRSSMSSPSLSSSPPPSLTRITRMSPISFSPSPKPSSTPQSDRHAALSSTLHPLLQRTLSPLPKDLSPVAERTPTFLPHLSKRSRSLQRSVFSPQSSGEEDDSFSLGFKLQDLTDVQVMARMQEESLRQELALPPRRSHSLGSFPSPTVGAPIGHEEECSDDDDYALPLPPPPVPRLTRLPHSHTFHALSSFSHWPRGATPLDTPPHPSATAGFAFHTPPLDPALELGSPSVDRGYRPGSDKLRRSLVRAPSMPSVPLPPSPSASPRASPCVLRSQSFDLSSGLSFLQSAIPPPGPLQSRVQSVGSFSVSRPPLKATAYVSPTIKSPAHLPPSSPLSPCLSQGQGSSSGIPLLSKHLGGSPASPRTALPRPTSFISTASSTPRSKVAQSGRSFLTPPKNLATLSALRDCAWRDGCY